LAGGQDTRAPSAELLPPLPALLCTRWFTVESTLSLRKLLN